MQVVITGGAGFIGSHVVEALIARGERVHVIDDLSTGSLENLAGVSGSSGLRVHEGSAADAALLDQLLPDCDVVFHLAAAVGVDLVMGKTAESLMNNLGTTQAVLQAADRAGCPVLFASSSEVYGSRVDVPFRESDGLVLGSTGSRRWSYAAAKATGEWLAMALARERGLRVVCARFFNTVGPRQSERYGMVLPRFVQQALSGEAITVFGDGAQTRCFSHVEDVVAILLRLIDCDAAWGEVVNVGSDAEVSVGALAELVRECCRSDSPIVHVDVDEALRTEDPQRRVPSLDRLRGLIGTIPSRSITEIVEDVATRQRSQRAITG